mmetsp:Transcript_29201/g.76655  ORF Transcript_29201/g.76655 Transcript_29201/m.76655 type:complete len:209 (-) Transcript_29201:454-1080(-)
MFVGSMIHLPSSSFQNVPQSKLVPCNGLKNNRMPLKSKPSSNSSQGAMGPRLLVPYRRNHQNPPTGKAKARLSQAESARIRTPPMLNQPQNPFACAKPQRRPPRDGQASAPARANRSQMEWSAKHRKKRKQISLIRRRRGLAGARLSQCSAQLSRNPRKKRVEAAAPAVAPKNPPLQRPRAARAKGAVRAARQQARTHAKTKPMTTKR